MRQAHCSFTFAVEFYDGLPDIAKQWWGFARSVVERNVTHRFDAAGTMMGLVNLSKIVK
jgi:hypothetical protein